MPTPRPWTTPRPLLAGGGVLAIARPDPMTRPVAMDLGRLHYDNIVYVGTTGSDLDAAYQGTPVRAALQAGGLAWIAGAGGAMGRMHVQRALESHDPPRLVLATEMSAERAEDLLRSFGSLAESRGATLAVIDPEDAPRDFATALRVAEVQGGIHDVQVLVADPDLVIEATHHLAPGGVVNLFAGLKRGTTAPINAWLIYGPAQIRLIGHSGSGLDDQTCHRRAEQWPASSRPSAASARSAGCARYRPGSKPCWPPPIPARS